MSVPTLVSGGARGIDTIFSGLSNLVGHEVVNYKAGMASSKEYRELLIKVNKKYLNRPYPSSSQYSNQLLERNAKIATEVDSIYAIGFMNNNIVDGGTAWAIYTFFYLNSGEKSVYFFDQVDNKWKTSTNGKTWTLLKDEDIPKPSGRYAGIGSRDPKASGCKVLEKLYKKSD